MTDPVSSRRRFVRNSLATTMSISFTGLIRAHGGSGGGQTTTWEPDGTTWESTFDTTWYGDETTYDTTLDTTWDPENTTIPDTTILETTIPETTAPQLSKQVRAKMIADQNVKDSSGAPEQWNGLTVKKILTLWVSQQESVWGTSATAEIYVKVSIYALKEVDNEWVPMDDDDEGEDGKTELQRYLGVLYNRVVTFSHPISQTVARDQEDGTLTIVSEVPDSNGNNTDVVQGISFNVRWNDGVVKITFGGWGVPSNTGNFAPDYAMHPE